MSANAISVESGGVLRFWHGCTSCSGDAYSWTAQHSSDIMVSISNVVQVHSGGKIEGSGVTIQAGSFVILEGGSITADGLGYPANYGPNGRCQPADVTCTGAGGCGSHARSGGGVDGAALGTRAPEPTEPRTRPWARPTPSDLERGRGARGRGTPREPLGIWCIGAPGIALPGGPPEFGPSAPGPSPFIICSKIVSTA